MHMYVLAYPGDMPRREFPTCVEVGRPTLHVGGVVS